MAENVKLTDIKINLTQKLLKQQETLQEAEEHKGTQSNEALSQEIVKLKGEIRELNEELDYLEEPLLPIKASKQQTM